MNSPRYLPICSQIDCFGDTDVYSGRAVHADQFAATKVGKKKRKEKKKGYLSNKSQVFILVSQPAWCQQASSTIQNKLKLFYTKFQKRSQSFSRIQIIFPLHIINVLSLTKPVNMDSHLKYYCRGTELLSTLVFLGKNQNAENLRDGTAVKVLLKVLRRQCFPLQQVHHS